MKQIEVLCKQSEQVRAVAAIIRKGDKIFATQRGYGEWQDWWEFPGGKMEAGETPEKALVREIREELSAEISVNQGVGESDHSPTLILRCYIASSHTLAIL